MNGFNLPRIQGTPRILLALLASSAVFTAGCANMATTAASSNALDTPATVTGKLHGGNQPVAFATVNLWFAGQGLTALASVGATTTSANDGAGSFSFVKGGSGANGYTCPASDPLVYLVATGGNTLNTGDNTVNNSASVFLAPLGLCNSLSSADFVDMSEVTTVATMAALQQYFNPSPTTTSTATAESFSTDGTGLAKQAMGLAFTLVKNMVDASTGNAVTTKTLSYGTPYTSGVGASTASVTATPETSKINTLANILASCINNASATAANCTTLFSNAAPPDPTVTSQPLGTTFTAATDVFQAIYYVLANPTNGSTTNLSNLFALQTAVGAPFQPALASAPSDWTIAISYTSSSTCGDNSGHLINSTQDLAVDTYGAVWLANSEVGTGNLSQLSSYGQPISCVAIGSGALTGVTIDSAAPQGNIWVADSGASNVYKYTPTTTSPITFPTAAAPYAIAADGTGNVYFTIPTTTSLYEIPGAAASSTAITPLPIAVAIGTSPSHIMVDNTPAVWTTSGSTFITRSASSTPNTGLGFTSTIISDDGPTYGISVTAIPSGLTDNYVYVSDQGASNEIFLHQGIGTSYSAVSGWPVTGLSTPTAVVSDGAQNVYTLNNATGTLFATGVAKQAISPSTGFVKSSTYLGSGRSMAIDQSGNIWIGLDGANSVTQIVGAAVPVFQPISNAIASGKFQLAP